MLLKPPGEDALWHQIFRAQPRVRAELQTSQGSSRALAARYGLNAKTVAKWRSSPSITGPRFMAKASRAIPAGRLRPSRPAA